MEFSVNPKVFELFPDLIWGVVLAKGVDNSGENSEITQLLRGVEAQIRKDFVEGQLGIDPRIIVWRQAYKKFGCDPHDYRSSIEALVRRVIKGGSIRHINTLVDLYNDISLKYAVPVGGEDLAKVKGGIELTLAVGNEPFIPLGEDTVEYPEVGEVIYKDILGVLCRRFNWREGERTKLTEETKDVILVIEGLPPAGREAIQQATSELAGLVEKYTGGKTETAVVDRLTGTDPVSFDLGSN